jgi:hypothetical protein
MGNLSASIVNQMRPILNIDFNYCDSFYVKERKFRNCGNLLMYTCIFYIEIISDFITETLIAVFFAR